MGILSFDAELTDPKEKVGKIFQYVDKVIMQNGIEGVFPVKEVATHIVKAVQPVELRRRVEYEPGKEVTKDLRRLYNFLLSRYAALYGLFPTGFINPTERKAGAVNQGASPSKIKCFNCLSWEIEPLTARRRKRNAMAALKRKYRPRRPPGSVLSVNKKAT